MNLNSNLNDKCQTIIIDYREDCNFFYQYHKNIARLKEPDSKMGLGAFVKDALRLNSALTSIAHGDYGEEV